MKRIAWLLLVALLLTAGTSLAQLPPLIDRELFFGDPEISGAQISPDGKYISFIKPFLNVRNIWVKARSDAFEKARPVTADTLRPVRGYFWSEDSRFILYAQDKGGDENFRIYAVDPAGPGTPVPVARDLTPMENVRAMIISVPRSTPEKILVGLNDRRADLHDVYRLDIVTGERTLLWKNEQNVAGWIADLKGDLRLGVRITETGGSEILKIDGDNLVPIYSVSPEESCSPVRFLPDGQKFYLITNKGTGTDKMQLEIFDLASGTTAFVEKDPLNQVDLSNVLFSDVTDELLATFYLGDKMRVYPRQEEFGKNWDRLKAALPGAELALAGTTKDEKVWMVSVSSDVDPGSRYIFDVASGTAELLYRSRPDLPSEHLAPMTALRYPARDGMEIPAYLTLPKGVDGKNLPVVMLIHGGPWARDVWGYDPEAQFLANRGYAVLQPNFRGSTGYGKKFLNAGNKQWGTGSMQHDITDGVKYLTGKGIADPKLVAIYGGSYGGYATLAGVAFTPDLYAAGVSYVGPSNIITLLNSIPPYWAPIKKIFAVRVGDMENPDDVKKLQEQSPLNSAQNIKAPLLVIQGANDPRVKKAESDQIVVAMRELGRPVEYIVAPDEGHGFAGKENRIAVYAAMEKFLAKHLGGRFQESMPAEIQHRLQELTVDVKTVKLPPPPPQESAPESMPSFDGSAVKPHSAKHVTTLNMRGQEFTITSTRTVAAAEAGGRKIWRVVEQSAGPMGAGVDTLELDGTTLLPIRRSTQQGPGVVSLVFESDKVRGNISGGPMSMPVEIATPEPVLADGAGTEIAVATLPLKTGLRGMIRTIDLMGGKTESMVFSVAAEEEVGVKAGTFRTAKVQFTKAEETEPGTTLWFDLKSRRVVKSETKLPPTMGGGTMRGELAE